jgi:hypothetical protein
MTALLRSRRISDACLSDRALDELALGALAPDADEHLASCESCAARRDELDADRDRPLPALRPLQPSTRVQPRRVTFAPTLMGALALAAAAAFTLTRAPQAGPPLPGVVSAIPAERLKGPAVELVATVERGAHQFRVISGDAVRPGDRVQLAYSTASAAHLYVIGVDGTGAVARYFPEPPGQSRVEDGREVELPFSLVLDAAPGPEQFFAFFCAAPVEWSALDAFVLSSTASAVPSGCEVASLELEKR